METPEVSAFMRSVWLCTRPRKPTALKPKAPQRAPELTELVCPLCNKHIVGTRKVKRGPTHKTYWFYIPSHNKPGTKVHCGPRRNGGAKYQLATEET